MSKLVSLFRRKSEQALIDAHNELGRATHKLGEPSAPQEKWKRWQQAADALFAMGDNPECIIGNPCGRCERCHERGFYDIE